MNHRPSQSRFTLSRSQAVTARIGRLVCLALTTTSVIGPVSVENRAGGAGAPPAVAMPASAVEPRRLAFGDLDRAFGVLAAGADIGEHVEHDEVGKCRRRLLADRAESARRQRTLGRL